MPEPQVPEIDEPTRRRRVRYRAWHRGTREMDLILGRFADAHIDAYGVADMQRLEQLMDESDTDLLGWIVGQQAPPERVDCELIEELARFHAKQD